jgi:hypothetical protein
VKNGICTTQTGHGERSSVNEESFSQTVMTSLFRTLVHESQRSSVSVYTLIISG